MNEIYKWWWQYRLSKREIETMKKNMKKVPIIQKKSDIYHQNQDIQAQLFIENSLSKVDQYESKIDIIKQNNIHWKNKILRKIKYLLLKIKKWILMK